MGRRTGAVLVSLLLLLTLAVSASAAAVKMTVGVRFWRESGDKESMADSAVDTTPLIVTAPSAQSAVSCRHGRRPGCGTAPTARSAPSQRANAQHRVQTAVNLTTPRLENLSI